MFLRTAPIMRTDSVVNRIPSSVPLSLNWWAIVRFNSRLSVHYISAHLDNVANCSKYQGKGNK